MPKIILADFNLGGLADSDFQGPANSLAKIVGCDIHSRPGVIMASNRLNADGNSGDIGNEIDVMVPCSDGNTYVFSKGDGSVFKRTAVGAAIYSGVHTITNTPDECLAAAEFNGYIYFATATKVGRWQIGSFLGNGNWDMTAGGGGDALHDFDNDDADFHPMLVKNLILYIGDGNQLAQVDDSFAFSSNALDLEEKYRIKSLGELGNDLLIGTLNSQSENKTKIFRWNTWSESWSDDDTVPEDAIDSFIPADNFVLVAAGNKGNLYAYQNLVLEQIKKIPEDTTSPFQGWSFENSAEVKPRAAAYFRGRPVFGLSNKLNDPAIQGVYSFGGYDSGYPKALSLEYALPELDELIINSIVVVDDLILVSWSSGGSFDIYSIDSGRYVDAYFETQVIRPQRIGLKKFRVRIPYRKMPGGSSISLSVKVNYGTPTAIALTQDTDRSLYYADIDIAGAVAIQFRVDFNPVVGAADSPEVESLEIDYDTNDA